MNRPSILFAHGAGLGSGAPWMQDWARRLSAVGDVSMFDYPYMRAGKTRPDRLPSLIQAHREALAELRATAPGPFVLAGKSMGSRIGCHLSLEEPVAGLICFGFPLIAASRARGGVKRRDEVLLALRTPVLFLQGTRDPLCPLAELERVRLQMVAPNALHVVEGGDHSLGVPTRGGVTQAQSDALVLAAIRAWLALHSATDRAES